MQLWQGGAVEQTLSEVVLHCRKSPVARHRIMLLTLQTCQPALAAVTFTGILHVVQYKLHHYAFSGGYTQTLYIYVTYNRSFISAL